MPGHNSQVIPANSNTPISFGTSGSVLIAVTNQSATPQANNIAVWDALSVAAISTDPNAKMIIQPVLTGGQILDCTVLNAGLRMNFGLVAIPSGPANPDGGWLFEYD